MMGDGGGCWPPELRNGGLSLELGRGMDRVTLGCHAATQSIKLSLHLATKGCPSSMTLLPVDPLQSPSLHPIKLAIFTVVSQSVDPKDFIASSALMSSGVDVTIAIKATGIAIQKPILAFP